MSAVKKNIVDSMLQSRWVRGETENGIFSEWDKFEVRYLKWEQDREDLGKG